MMQTNEIITIKYFKIEILESENYEISVFLS